MINNLLLSDVFLEFNHILNGLSLLFDGLGSNFTELVPQSLLVVYKVMQLTLSTKVMSFDRQIDPIKIFKWVLV
jgi:hypothetical protein